MPTVAQTMIFLRFFFLPRPAAALAATRPPPAIAAASPPGPRPCCARRASARPPGLGPSGCPPRPGSRTYGPERALLREPVRGLPYGPASRYGVSSRCGASSRYAASSPHHPASWSDDPGLWPDIRTPFTSRQEQQPSAARRTRKPTPRPLHVSRHPPGNTGCPHRRTGPKTHRASAEHIKRTFRSHCLGSLLPVSQEIRAAAQLTALPARKVVSRADAVRPRPAVRGPDPRTAGAQPLGLRWLVRTTARTPWGSCRMTGQSVVG